VTLGISDRRARGKELEENGFGVVLDKKRARPLRPRPDRFFVLGREPKLEAVQQGVLCLVDGVGEFDVAVGDGVDLLEVLEGLLIVHRWSPAAGGVGPRVLGWVGPWQGRAGRVARRPFPSGSVRGGSRGRRP